MKTRAVFSASCGTAAIMAITSFQFAANLYGQAPQPTPAEFVTVGGQVKIPGRIAYAEGMTVSNALVRVGGATAEAGPDVQLRRGTNAPLILNRFAIENGKAKDVSLRPNDSVIVPLGSNVFREVRRKLKDQL